MSRTTPEQRADLARLVGEALPDGWHDVHWYGNVDHPSVQLSTWVPGWGRTSLMRFERWGMQSGQPWFLGAAIHMMTKGADLVTYEVAPRAVGVQQRGMAYRGDITGFAHPFPQLLVALLNALPDLLADLEDAKAERERLTVALGLAQARAADAEDEVEVWCSEADATRSVLAGRCLADITHRDEEHRQSVCVLPVGHASAHDDCMGCTWTDADHWEPSAIDRVRALHCREVRWGDEDYSIDAEEYAERRAENDEALDALDRFDVCAECYRIEQSIEQRDDGVAVLEGLWPCPTIRALDESEADR